MRIHKYILKQVMNKSVDQSGRKDSAYKMSTNKYRWDIENKPSSVSNYQVAV